MQYRRLYRPIYNILPKLPYRVIKKHEMVAPQPNKQIVTKSLIKKGVGVLAFGSAAWLMGAACVLSLFSLR